MTNHGTTKYPNQQIFLIKLSNKIGEAKLSAILFFLLLSINVVLNPVRFSFANIGTTIGLMSPLILASIASVPVLLSGRGGIDISIGPLMALSNVIVVQVIFTHWQITSPWLVIPLILVIGMISGFINGFLSAVLHIQPIVATLSTYLIYSSLALWIMPAPGGSIPSWMIQLSKNWSFLPILGVVCAWWGIKKLPFYGQLRATGGDDRAAYTSGINVTHVRMGAYILTGVITAVGALALGALIGSGDPNVGPNYTMTAIAGAVLGGVSLAGGVGGILGAALGATDIFLLQSILTFFNVSPFALQMAFGIILVISLVLNSSELSSFFGKSKQKNL